MRFVPLATGLLLLCFAGCSEPAETAQKSPGTDPSTGGQTPAGGYASMAGTDGAGAETAQSSMPASPDETQLDAMRAHVAANPDDDASRRRLAMALLQTERTDESIEQFRLLAEKNPGPVSTLDLALAYGHATRLAEAEQTYKLLLEQVPNHHIAMHNLGNLAIKRGNYEGSLEYYVRAITVKPDYLMAYAHLADALKALNRYEEAYRNYERVLMLEPKTAAEATTYDDALYQLASLDINMGATERAILMLSELIKVNPRHPKAHYAMGQALMLSGKPEEAQREFEIHMEIKSTIKPSGAMASSE